MPEQTSGAALFADVSGFTPLTEALTRTLGPKDGADELTRQLNRVYDALIAQVHRYGGSVISFAGDAITCWFAGDTQGSLHPACTRAVACALAMQQAMVQFATVPLPDGETIALAMKVAVASGPARRFLVGDPAIQIIDVLAGETLMRMAAAEHLANKGEVVIDAQTAALLGEKAQVREIEAQVERPGKDGDGERFFLVEKLAQEVEPAFWTPLSSGALSELQMRSWLLPPVYERLREGLGEFLTELRPAVSLFLRFGEIDYDGDEAAGAKLDGYIRWVQKILTRYGGQLLQLSIGDKGSFLYAVFGAPIAHENNTQRALSAALELRTSPADLRFVDHVQIGISQGKMRVGAYGGRTRRTYGVIGDEVNLAARLMQHAGSGEVLVNQRAQKASAQAFIWETLPAVAVKGKSKPIPVARLLSKRELLSAASDLLHHYTSALVGREVELARLQSILEFVLKGEGQILGLQSRAGIGKSHLTATFAAKALQQNVQVCIGVCEGTTQHVAYFPWRQIFRALLALDTDDLQTDATSTAHQIARLKTIIQPVNPDWVRLPLLGDLLGLPIPDNATTAAFDPRLRQEALFTMTIELLQTYARVQPLLLIVEDAHWMDEASLGLMLALGRIIKSVPAMVMLVRRPPVRKGEVLSSELNQLSLYHQLDLDELQWDEIAELVTNQLDGELSALALAVIQNQSQGNPFFAQELVDALRETGNLICIDDVWMLSEDLINALRKANCLTKDATGKEWALRDDAQLSTVSMGIPDSIHGAVLSRLDRLPESHKLTLKVASVIGRVFELAVLARAHPTRISNTELREQQGTFAKRDFVQLEFPLPRETYRFKHNVTQEVVYETLPTAQQRDLHRAVGTVLESIQHEAVEQLAYHFRRGGAGAQDKALFYLDKAARKAQREYANETALNYYNQALALKEHWEWRKGQIEVMHILGRREAEQAALLALEAIPEAPAYEVAYLWGRYYEAVSDYAQAQSAIEHALATSQEQADWMGEANSLIQLGLIARRQGDYERAKSWFKQTLALFQKDQAYSPEEATVYAEALNNLGIVHRQQGDFEKAKAYYQQALMQSRQGDNRKGEAEALNSLGVTASYQRLFSESMSYHEQALEIRQTIGDRAGEGTSLYNLATAMYEAGSYDDARARFSQALLIQQAVGNRWEEVNVWMSLGILHREVGDFPKAQDCLQNGLQLSREIGDEAGQAYILINLALVMRDQDDLGVAEQLLLEGLELAQKTAERYIESGFLSQLGIVALKTGRLEQAIDWAKAALAMRTELDMRLWTTDNLATLATAHWSTKQTALALDFARQALDILDECGGQGPECPQQDYFMCYQVLASAGEIKTAHQALRSALALVMARAEKITDPGLRQSFLEQVPINRQIVQEWDALNLEPTQDG